MKIHDRVKLKNLVDIDLFGFDKYNPLEEIGTVLKLDGELFPVWVLWDNGIRNSYNESHLEIA